MSEHRPLEDQRLTRFPHDCQTGAQNFLDHIIDVPDDMFVKPECLYGIDEDEFIDGLKALTNVLRGIYADIIQNPVELDGSPRRFVALLHTMVRCGELVDNRVIVNKAQLSEKCKKLHAQNKITGANVLYKTLIAHGFEIEGFNGKTLDRKAETFALSFLDNNNLIPALYGYMKTVSLKKHAIISLNYFLVTPKDKLPENFHSLWFAQYFNETEKEFFLRFHEHLVKIGLIVDNADDYIPTSFRIGYKRKLKDSVSLARCFSNNGLLSVHLRLRKIDRYSKHLETLPEHIKQLFRVKSNCRHCSKNCSYLNAWMFEGIEYALCGFNQYFIIKNYDINDVEWYNQIMTWDKEEK